MNNGKKKTEELALAKSGISGRIARRIESAVTLPSQRYWLSRPDLSLISRLSSSKHHIVDSV